MHRFCVAALCALLASPSLASVSREELQKALDENPDLILNSLKKNTTSFFQLIILSQHDYQVQQEQERLQGEKKERDDAFKNPDKPVVDAKSHIRGNPDAPITVVEYSDFQCPYCGRGYRNMEQVRKKYGEKLRFVYKNFPLISLHPQALSAAQWFEAVALQSREKAWRFHDRLFENQDKLSEDYFRKVVKELGLDAAKAAKDAKSKAVQDRIDADSEEARKFGFTGTPGFLVNGVPIRGSYPPSEFDAIINDPRFGKS